MLFLAFGSIWFWLLLVAEFCALLWFVEEEWPFRSFLSLVLVFTLLWWLGDFNVITWAASLSLKQILVGALGYVGTGIAWSIGKWYFYVTGERRKFDEYVEDRLKHGHYVKNYDETQEEFDTRCRKDARSLARLRHGKPEARKQKSRIVMWMGWWPWSALWTLINDPIKRLFREIFHRIQRVFEKIANSAYAGTEDSDEQ